MTDEEWAAFNLAEALNQVGAGPGALRKLRLFAVACFREIPGQHQDPWSVRAVEAAERYADGRADALMDAGCADEEVVAHCQGPGPHARGCWVVDWLLGKG